MSSSVCRRLHGLFTTTKTTSLPKTPKPTATAAATTLKLSPAKSSGPPNDKNLVALVGQFKKACRSSRFRHHSHKAYFKIVHRLAVANKHSYIEEIIEHQKQYPDITNECFAVRLICLYGKSGMFDHAHKLFDEMPQLNCERTVMSFNALLSASVNSKKFDKISELLNELPEKLSIKPDTVSYNTVVKAFCEMGSLDSAVSVVIEMEKSGVEPNLITFNTLLDALYRNDRFEEAEKLWGLMQDKNVFPSSRSYNPKIRALVAGKRISEAVEVFQEMGSKGVKPDVYTFNALIKGFCDDENLEEAKRRYKEMGKNDCYPAATRIQGRVRVISISRSPKSEETERRRKETMSYWDRGHQDTGDDVDDFDEFDPTPYGGGYDINLTYGRPLPPSEELCYPNTSSSSDEFDYDRPQYTSYAEPSAYADEALDNEYKSYARPKPRPSPSYGAPPGEGFGGGYDGPKPGYAGGGGGFGSGPDYGGGYGGRPEPPPEYGSGHGRRPEPVPSSEYGSGYGRKSEYEEPSSDFGSGYGRKSEYEEPSSDYGSGYGRRPQSSEYEAPPPQPPSYEEEGGDGYGYGGRPKRSEYDAPPPQPPRYGEEEEGGGGYGYGGRPQRSEYEAPPPPPPSYGSYGRSEEEEYPKPSYERRHDDEGYGRKKYGDNNSDDEDEEKKSRHHHHHRKHYDD